MGIGYDTVNQALVGQLGLVALLTIALAKILATALGIGLGLPGGLIGPTMVIGATAGGAIGLAADAWLDLVVFVVSLGRNETFVPTRGQRDAVRRDALITWEVAVENAGNDRALGLVLTDPLPASTTFEEAVAAYGGDDVLITGGATASCVAEAGGVDTNGDSCYRTATDLVVGAAAATTFSAMMENVLASSISLSKYTLSCHSPGICWALSPCMVRLCQAVHFLI